MMRRLPEKCKYYLLKVRLNSLWREDSADVVDYSRLMAEDEATTVRTLAACRESVSSLVEDSGTHCFFTATPSL